jgi:TadE-like protein
MSEQRIGQPAPAEPGRSARPKRRLRLRFDPRGQSLVEFAISFPVLMLMILFGVDFGRVFLGWVQLNSAVREAANFAAINPAAWGTPGNAPAQAEYNRLITAETMQTNCTLPDPLPQPTFPSGTDVGSPSVVEITCRFSLITPVIGNILGDAINVSASAAFPIRSGLMGGTAVGPGLPSFSPGPTAPTESVDPGTSPIPTPSQLPTPVPVCVVPDYQNVNSSQATRMWTDAGFTANNLTFNPLVPPHYKIKKQTIRQGEVVACGSTMTVAP